MNIESMSDFTKAYIDCMLWSSGDGELESLSEYYDYTDIAPEAIKKIVKDCNKFIEVAGPLLDGYDEQQAGHDFWLTRNRHGAGFWDRTEYPKEVINQLTEISQKKFKEVHPYVGDDGKIYLM